MAAFIQMTPVAYIFGITANISLVVVLFFLFRARSFSEYIIIALLPAIVFGWYTGALRPAIIFFGVLFFAYGTRRRISWQSWFAYPVYIVVSTVALYALVDWQFLMDNMFLVRRELAVNVGMGMALYAFSARFSRTMV